jgi:hypothetical protein
MAETFATRVSITKTGTSTATVVLDANTGNLTLGGSSTDGDVLLKDNSGLTRIHLDPGGHTIKIRDASNNLIAELGRNGNLRLGGSGSDGDVEIYRSNGQRTMHFDGDGGNLWLGGNGTDGDIVMFPSGVANSNSTSQATIHLDANAGDIVLKNADAAEDFDVIGDDVEPGSVLVIDDEGKLRTSDRAYDRRVAGVVSGAGSLRPGLILGRHGKSTDRLPIALAGRVFVNAIADEAPIAVGDMLTTSSTRGHAMRASDPGRAFGSVIGKALAPLRKGMAQVPILVALQ